MYKTHMKKDGNSEWSDGTHTVWTEAADARQMCSVIMECAHFD